MGSKTPTVLLAAAFAGAAAVTATALVPVLGGESQAATPTKVEYFAQVAAICRVYGPRLDRVRPPDVAEPANVIAAIRVVLPLVEAQTREVRALRAPAPLRAELARWLDLQDRRLDKLERALHEAERQDYRAMSVAYVDFLLASPQVARLGSAIGIPHPPC